MIVWRIYDMNINDFIVNFAEQFVDTGAEELSPETKFKELEEC